MRSKALTRLLESIKIQTLSPESILVIDSSTNDETKDLIKSLGLDIIDYYQVDDAHRGLTKQRNYGVSKVPVSCDIVCFLDDDTILDPTFFEKLLSTYQLYPEALGVGGYITNEVTWNIADGSHSSSKFYYEGWMREEPFRFRVRTRLGLHPDRPPCYLPTFSHGRSVSFLPPSGRIYEVEHFMGGVASYRREVFEKIQFSSYFDGYGLYEDADFCFRLATLGKLYVHTDARLEHHHEVSGRPNMYRYGKMVLRNGWYIWKVRYPHPKPKATIKWHLTALVLMSLTFMGVFTSNKKKQALQEGMGRLMGWCSLFFNKPKVRL